MAADSNEWVQTLEKTEGYNSKMLDKVLAAAQPGAIFGAPVSHDGYTIITANEVMAGGGYGFGTGSSNMPSGSAGADQTESPSAGGGGGGGGGYSSGRPVAIIVLGPDGARVEPIVDVTKLGIAGISAWIAIFVTLRGIFKK